MDRQVNPMSTNSKVTMKDIASFCGVSVATVSRVLNENYYVTPELKQRVLKTVKELNYSPNNIARSLKLNKSGMIGYITSDISNSYHITIAKAIEDVIRPHNYNLIVCSTNNDRESEEKHLKLLASRGVDALVLNSCGESDPLILNINRTIPMVLVNRRLNTPEFHGDLADCNNVLGMYLLTKELLSFGHKRILLIEGPSRLSNVKERFRGFQTAMEEAGIDVLHYPYRIEGDFSVESGFHAIDYLLHFSEELRPTAVIGTNNMTTLGAMKGIIHHNLSVPTDISLAGFNTIEYTELMVFHPTIAAFDPYKIGHSAGVSILERIHDNTIENREYIFPPTLISGNSICTPKNG